MIKEKQRIRHELANENKVRKTKGGRSRQTDRQRDGQTGGRMCGTRHHHVTGGRAKLGNKKRPQSYILYTKENFGFAFLPQHLNIYRQRLCLRGNGAKRKGKGKDGAVDVLAVWCC